MCDPGCRGLPAMSPPALLSAVLVLPDARLHSWTSDGRNGCLRDPTLAHRNHGESLIRQHEQTCPDSHFWSMRTYLRRAVSPTHHTLVASKQGVDGQRCHPRLA